MVRPPAHSVASAKPPIPLNRSNTEKEVEQVAEANASRVGVGSAAELIGAGVMALLLRSQITLDALLLDLADGGGGGAEVAADGAAGGIRPDDGLAMQDGGGVDGFMGVFETDVPVAVVMGGAGECPGEQGVKPRPLAGQG